MKRRLSLLLLGGLIWGCNSVATDKPGVFVDNIEGMYDLAAVTENNACTASFDTVVQVVQTKDKFSILSQTAGFDDLQGLFDEGSEDTYTLTGGDKKCTGTSGHGLLTNICIASVQVCTSDATGTQTCTTVDHSCEVTYQKR